MIKGVREKRGVDDTTEEVQIANQGNYQVLGRHRSMDTGMGVGDMNVAESCG